MFPTDWFRSLTGHFQSPPICIIWLRWEGISIGRCSLILPAVSSVIWIMLQRLYQYINLLKIPFFQSLIIRSPSRVRKRTGDLDWYDCTREFTTPTNPLYVYWVKSMGGEQGEHDTRLRNCSRPNKTQIWGFMHLLFCVHQLQPKVGGSSRSLWQTPVSLWLTLPEDICQFEAKVSEMTRLAQSFNLPSPLFTDPLTWRSEWGYRIDAKEVRIMGCAAAVTEYERGRGISICLLLSCPLLIDYISIVLVVWLGNRLSPCLMISNMKTHYRVIPIRNC